MNWLATKVEFYLPVFIPLLLTVISVLAGILTGRIKLSLNSLLQIHSDVVLGLFSFVIWALVTYQQTGTIALNQKFSITLVRVVLLLFANFILLIFGLIILRVHWHELEPIARSKHPQGWENVLNGSFLIVTMIVAFAPINLAVERIAPKSPAMRPVFAVVVPYSDPSIARQIGIGKWANRTLCSVTEQAADSTGGAIASAIAAFGQSPYSKQLLDRTGSSSVIVDADHAVASAVRR